MLGWEKLNRYLKQRKYASIMKERFAAGLQTASSLSEGQIFSQFLGMGASTDRDVPQPLDFERLADEGFRNNTVIYACVKEISRSVAEPQIQALTIQSDGTEVVDDPERDQLARLITVPNAEQDSYEFFEQLVIHLMVAGNAFIFKIRSTMDQVVGLKLLSPDIMGIVKGRTPEEGFIAGYTIEIDAQKMFIPADDIIHFKLPDAFDELWGLSPIFVLARFGDIDLQSTEFLRTFFFNRGIPAGVLTFNTPVQKTERERVRDMWNEQFQGLDGWHRVSVLDANVTYQALSTAIKEMDLDPIFGQTETRICSVYGVPPILIGAKVGLDRSTFSNVGESRTSFWTETLVPLYTRLSQRLTRKLAIQEFGTNRRINFDLSDVPALQENIDAVRTFSLAAWNDGLITRNEAREMVGMDPLDDTDVTKQSLTNVLVPVGSDIGTLPFGLAQPIADDTRQLPQATAGIAASVTLEVLRQWSIDEGEHYGLNNINPILERWQRFVDDDADDPEWKSIHREADKRIIDIINALKTAFDSVTIKESQVIEGIDNLDMMQILNGIDTDAIGRSLNNGELPGVLRNLFEDTAQNSIQFISSDLTEGFFFDGERPDVAASLSEQIGDLISDVNNEQATVIQQMVQDLVDGRVQSESAIERIREVIGINRRQQRALSTLVAKLEASGLTADEVNVAANKAITRMRDFRAEMIARTESINTASRGQAALWKQMTDDGIFSPDDTRKFWVVTPDDRLDQKVCAPIPALNPNGQPVTDPFITPVGPLQRPTAHPMCRCAVSLVFLDTEGQFLSDRPGFDQDGNPTDLDDVGRSVVDNLTGA